MTVKFGDEIDWGAEARRAAADDPPGATAGEALERARAALGACPPGRRWRVGDLGCNIGRFYPQFAAAGFEYVGVDQSEEALRIARSRWPARFELSLLWEDWPARIGSLDVGLCNAVLQHNTHEEKERILPRVAQAVRPGGVFVMQESTVPDATRTQLRHDEWVRLVERHGFSLLETWHPNPEYGLKDAYLFRRRS